MKLSPIEHDWLPEPPSSWQVVPAWSLFAEGNEGFREDDPHLIPSRLHGVVTQDQYTSLTGLRTMSNEVAALVMKHVDPDDFVISMGSHETGIEHSPVAGKVSNDYRVLKPTKYVVPAYYRWFFKSRPLIEGLAGLTNEIRVGQRIHYTKFATLWLPLPEAKEQQRIADYLDRETGEIDAMIAKMDQLAEKLEARRVAAIRAYAGSSGGSKIRPLQWFATLTTGSTPTGGTKPENFSASQGIGWVTPEDLGGTVSPSRFLSSAALEQMTLVRAESTLVCGIGATVGKLGYTNSLVTTNQQITALIPHKHVHGRFLFYAMAAERSQLLANTVTTTLPIINNSRLGSLHIKSCAYDEQKRIADHLDEVTNKIDTMLAKVAELRSLLTERRAALITEVVTGRKEVA